MDSQVLLHACCGPCATVGTHALREEGFRLTLYFYGGNIHPYEEWERRLCALRLLAAEHDVQLAVRPYDTSEWDEAVKGLESEREGGARCVECMKLQLKSAADEAKRLGIENLCTSLTLSPQKKPENINLWGLEAARASDLNWINRIWRKRCGFAFSVSESKRLGLYRQNYCGCRYSLRDRLALQREKSIV